MKKNYIQLAKEIKDIIVLRFNATKKEIEEREESIDGEAKEIEVSEEEELLNPSPDIEHKTNQVFNLPQQSAIKEQIVTPDSGGSLLALREEEEAEELDLNLAKAEPYVDSRTASGDYWYWKDNVQFPIEYSAEKMRKIIETVKFIYDEGLNKFKINYDEKVIDYIALSPQIAYTLGFEGRFLSKHQSNVAKYSYNINGGINSFCVYSNGLTENIIIGNELASLLRVVSVIGGHGDTIEMIYDSPVFSRVLPKQINEIELELRTLEGKLVPFQFGTTIATLIFKKVIVF
ncbi:MAG TPA: hypothetical protein VFV08_02050 [Puia sp.]|nr:hypothetical protein [Puia sp.]